MMDTFPGVALAELSRRCDDHARRDAERTREIVTVGPFCALLNPENDLIWLNYAVPIGPFEPANLSAALDELRQVFIQHQRIPRFEFNALAWPGLAVALEQSGFVLQVENPLMVCTPQSFRPFTDPLINSRLLTHASNDAELHAILIILGLSFGSDQPVTDADMARKRAELANSPYVEAIADLEGLPAGTATISPIGDIAELTGVATHPAMRRRGVAAAISSFLVQTHFNNRGQLAWLSAADAAAQAVYQKIGFQLIDVRLNYIDSPEEL